MPGRPMLPPTGRPTWAPALGITLLAVLLAVAAGWGAPAGGLPAPSTPTPAPDAAGLSLAVPVAEAAAPLEDRLAVADFEEPPAAAPEPTAAPLATPTPPAVPTATLAPTMAVDGPPPSTATPEPVVPTATPGPPRVGLQVGHWKSHELPEELARLRGSTGGAGGGRQEWEVNLEVAEKLAARLRERGYIVDILPATVPPGYLADVFVAIHADANLSAGPRGFKIARSRWTRLVATDDTLTRILREEYGRTTGLPWDDGITRNMTGYYAFNNRRRQHAIDKRTPAVILEMGFLTNPLDRAVLFNRTALVVEGIERGLVRFLDERPPLAEREQPATTGAVIEINEGGATVRAAPNGGAEVLARLEAGRRQEAPEIVGEWYGIWVAERNGPGWVHRSEATLHTVQLP